MSVRSVGEKYKKIFNFHTVFCTVVLLLKSIFLKVGDENFEKIEKKVICTFVEKRQFKKIYVEQLFLTRLVSTLAI